MVSDFSTKSDESVGVVNWKSSGPDVSDAKVDEAVRYTSVAWSSAYDDPVVVETPRVNMFEPGVVPRVHVVPLVAFVDFTLSAAFEPSLVTVCD
jgi:hypothetical protein